MIQPAGQERAVHRSQADPRRLEAAGGDRRLSRRRRRPVLRPGRQEPDGRPGAADVQAAADQPRAGRPARPDLRLRPSRHRGGPDRPPRAGDDRVPVGLGPVPGRAGPRVRRQRHGATASTRPAAPVRASTSRRSTASRSLGHQGLGSITDITIRRLLTLQGSMRPDEIVSDMSYQDQTEHRGAADHTNRIQIDVHPGLRLQPEAVQADQAHPQAGPVDPADQPHQPDPRAGRPDRARASTRSRQPGNG